MSIERFCRKSLVRASPDDTVAQATRLMLEHHVGAVVVVDAAGRPEGILTDRDVACRVVAEGRDPAATAVWSVMTAKPATVRRSGTIDEASMLMRERGVRRLPIVDDEGKFCGLVSLDDLSVLLSAEMSQLVGAVRANQGP